MPRITSSGTYAEFKHGRTDAEQVHVQHLYFHADVSGGTFRLRVNGELTADITIVDTYATDEAAIQSALDALPSLSPSDIVVSGSALTDVTLTGAANGNYRIEIPEDYLALTGNSTVNDDLTTEVTQIGGEWIALSADMSEFSYEETAETTDVTGLSELEQEVLVVKSNASFSLSLYEANQTWSPLIYAGVEGRMRVFNEGKVVGKKYLEMECLLETVSGNTPDHDVLEKEISGMRQGAWIAPPDSYWKGS